MTRPALTANNFAMGCFGATPLASDAERPPLILLVDDEERALESMRTLLAGRGYDLTVAASGSEAIRQLNDSRIDLVLLDLRLNDMHGHDIMDFISDNGMDTTTIVVSGNTDIESAIGALQRGAYGYLRKPYEPEELLNRVNNAIQKRALESRNRHIAWRLENSERIYRSLVDNSPDIIYTLDKNGCFTFVNERAQQVLGFTPEELIGQHYSTIVHQDDIGRAKYVFSERRANSRYSRNVELRLKSSIKPSGELTFEQTVMTVSFNSMGIYLPNNEEGNQSFFGTYVVARDVTERKRAEELISYQAYHDILTNLPNRILFKDQLSLAILQARRSETGVAVMLINLDRFKLINDEMGHVRGDDLLQQISMRLKQSMRNGSMLARHGGDEFTVILPSLKSRQDAAAMAADIVERVRQPVMLDHQEINISASIGIAIYPDDGDSSDDLFRHADIAMYQVKTRSKDGFGFYDESMREAHQQSIRREASLRKAIEKHELEMYYQPQVDLPSGKIVGAEALMRWNHPDEGLLTAGQFLPFAQESGLMLPLSSWMLGAVCRDIVALRAAGCEPLRIAINISPQSLDGGNLFGDIQNALVANDIPPQQMEVEVTENICIRNPQYAIDQLDRLSQLGIGVAIDDFGTGYSSLAYLHRFPIHTIKIDQVFVREIQSDSGHYPVVLALISIARGLGLNLIAEGVENVLQARYLERSGCQVMQGYHFHRPVSRDRLMQLLKEQSPSPG